MRYPFAAGEGLFEDELRLATLWLLHHMNSRLRDAVGERIWGRVVGQFAGLPQFDAPLSRHFSWGAIWMQLEEALRKEGG